VFTKITIGVAAFWILLCILALNILGRQQSKFSASTLGASAPIGTDNSGGALPAVDKPAATTAAPAETDQKAGDAPAAGGTTAPAAGESPAEPAPAADAAKYASEVLRLTQKARHVVRDLDPKNDLEIMRLRAKDREILAAPGDEEVLLSASGAVFEGLQTNFFALNARGELETAPDGDVLAGTVRAVVLAEAARAGVAVRMQAPRLADAHAWRGAFMRRARFWGCSHPITWRPSMCRQRLKWWTLAKIPPR
jgi:hypothetical protein